MIIDVIQEHVVRRLKFIHLSGIATMVAFFFLLRFLGATADIETLPAQMILLLMALLSTLSYATLIGRRTMDPPVPLLLFFSLNVCTTALVWATGVLQSPFIILYVILIIITSQLYRYSFGLLQTIFALAGFVGVFTATVEGSIPYYPLLPYTNASILFQPAGVILVYGLLYGMLFLFTVLSSSSARTLLFRPMQKVDLDTTFQEKIIQDMPLGIIILDNKLQVLGNNPAAAAEFPVKIAAPLSSVLPIKDDGLLPLLLELVQTQKEKSLSWKLDTGATRPVTLSARMMKGKEKEDTTYILFVQ